MDYFLIQVFIMEGDFIDTTGTAFHGVDWDVGIYYGMYIENRDIGFRHGWHRSTLS